MGNLREGRTLQKTSTLAEWTKEELLHQVYSEWLRARHVADHAKIRNAVSSKKWKC